MTTIFNPPKTGLNPVITCVERSDAPSLSKCRSIRILTFSLLLTAAMVFTAFTASAATVSGRVLFDRNRTANIAGGGISGIANVPVVLQNIATNEMLAVLTDVSGNYAFNNVPDGNYRIVQTFGISAGTTPGNYTLASVGAVPNSQTPPISYAPSPPAGATHLDFVTPGTLLITVTNNMDVANHHFLNGPVKNTPYADDRIDWTTNLITDAENGTFGTFPQGTPANTGVPTEPYPGVVPDFTYVLPNPAIYTPDDGEYSVQNIMNNNYNNTIGSWWRVSDHTTGNETGRMLVVNGDTPGAVIFTQTVSVTANTDYFFSAWMLNLFKVSGWANPALGVKILDSGGGTLYTETLGSTIPVNTLVPEWKQIGAFFNSGSNTTITVQFTSEGPAAVGNDFAMDDFSLNLVNTSPYGLLFHVPTGKFYLDINNNSAYDTGTDTEYTGQSANWHFSNDTLYLNSFKWETPTAVVLGIVGGDVIIDITDTNTFASTYNGSEASVGIHLVGNLTLTGSGILNAKSGSTSGNSLGILCEDINFTNGVVNATGGSGYNSNGIGAETVNISGGSVNATGGTATNWSFGFSYIGSITTLHITGGTVTAKGNTRAINGTVATLPAAYRYRTNTTTTDPGSTADILVPPAAPFSNASNPLFVRIAAPTPVTITGITATKVYDTTNSFTNAQIDVTGATIVGKVASDDVYVIKTGVTGTLPSANAGTSGNLTLTGSFALSGTDADNYALSAQPTVAATITKANTTTTLSSSLNPSDYVQSVTFTATVSVVSPGGGIPAGTVEFREGSTVLSSETLDASGVATFSISTLNAGTHPIMAYYLENTNHDASNSSAETQVVNKKQLTVSTPSLTKTKTYDGNTTAAVTAGTLSGVVSPDIVTVTATATYDNANVGTGKTITVVYTLGGTDAANYTAPANDVVTDGAITPPPVAPVITGPATMTLTEGYAATASGTFTIGGNPAPTVSKTSGNAAITWDNAAKCLNIIAGLPAGTYPVVITASNSEGTVTHTFTLTVDPPPTAYSIHISSPIGGTVSADRMSALPGETVTLTVTPNAGYELKSISATGTTINGSGSNHWFMMPASNVTVTAHFENPVYQMAWEAALKLIEAATFTLTQQQAPDAATARFRLAEMINELIKETGFVITPYDIVIYTFEKATAGKDDLPAGVNGRFEFRVTPPESHQSAYSSGTITASPVANEQLRITNYELRGWGQNGILHVSGLTPGTTWRVYNMTGILIYTGIAVETHGRASLPERGIYIIVHELKTVKITL